MAKITGGSCVDGYTYSVEAYVCIEIDNRLKVYWNGWGCSNDYQEVLNVPNWGGNAVTANFTDGGNWCQGGTADAPISLTATLVGSDTDGSSIVQIDWSVTATNCYDFCSNDQDTRNLSGSFDVIAQIGVTCSIPSDPDCLTL